VRKERKGDQGIYREYAHSCTQPPLIRFLHSFAPLR